MSLNSGVRVMENLHTMDMNIWLQSSILLSNHKIIFLYYVSYIDGDKWFNQKDQKNNRNSMLFLNPGCPLI